MCKKQLRCFRSRLTINAQIVKYKAYFCIVFQQQKGWIEFSRRSEAEDFLSECENGNVYVGNQRVDGVPFSKMVFEYFTVVKKVRSEE